MDWLEGGVVTVVLMSRGEWIGLEGGVGNVVLV